MQCTLYCVLIIAIHFLKKLMREACLVPLLGEDCSAFTFTGLSLAPPPLILSVSFCGSASGSLSSSDVLSHTFSVTTRNANRSLGWECGCQSQGMLLLHSPIAPSSVVYIFDFSFFTLFLLFTGRGSGLSSCVPLSASEQR